MAAPTAPSAARARAERRASARLTGAGAFQAVFDQGLRREGRYVQLVYVPVVAADVPGGRYGFVVGRKVIGRAVDRNRFKRVVRERLRALRDEIAKFDLIVRVKRPVERGLVDTAAAEAIALVERVCSEAKAQ